MYLAGRAILQDLFKAKTGRCFDISSQPASFPWGLIRPIPGTEKQEQNASATTQIRECEEESLISSSSDEKAGG